MTVLYLLCIVVGLWLLARTVHDFQNQQTSLDALFDYMGPDWDVNPDSHSFLYWLALGAQAVAGFSALSGGIAGLL